MNTTSRVSILKLRRAGEPPISAEVISQQIRCEYDEQGSAPGFTIATILGSRAVPDTFLVD